MVSGMLAVNWLPNAWEAVLPYQAAKLACTFSDNLVVATFSPPTGLNCTSICVIERPVAYPVTSSVNPLVVLLLIARPVSLGADCGTLRVSAGGFVGVTSMALVCVAKAGVMLMVPATVPVCTRICVALFGNTACVEPAGMVKVTVRPPLANCTAGSLAKASGVKGKVSVPVSGSP